MMWIFAAALMIIYPLAGGILRRRETTPRPTISAGEDPALHLKALRHVLISGNRPKRWLVDEAVREAFEMGDWKTVSALSIAFQTQSPSAQAPSDEPASDELSDDPPEDASKPRASASPIEGVPDDEWLDFMSRLKTQEPTFKSERAVGAFYHNVDRLAQLNIDPATLADFTSQQVAIAKDIAEYRKTERKLIDDFGGDLIQINGQTHPITMSGILGVIKSAGPKNARSWFKNPSDREAHPHTTETFLRTNGVF